MVKIFGFHIKLHCSALIRNQFWVDFLIFSEYNLVITYWRHTKQANGVYMDIPARYRKKICGMCGNFNGNQRDDMMNFDGKRVARSLKEFLGWMKVDYEGDLSKVWVHYIDFALRWGTASKGASRRRIPPKRGSSLSRHWMGHLLSYSLSGGHDGAMLPINPRGLNGPDQPF